MVVIVMLPARGIAALSSAQLPVLISRLSMGSQKCMGAACASTLKGEIAKKSPLPWQMGYNFFGARHCQADCFVASLRAATEAFGSH